MTALRGAALRSYFSQPIVDAFDPSLLIDSPVAHRLDFRTISDTELQRIEIPFQFTAAFTANMHGIAGWFDVEFLGTSKKVVLTTAPGEPTTHWHQLRCMFQHPVFVMAGQVIAGTLLMQAHERQSYWMHLTLHEPIQVQNTFDLKEPHQREVGFFVPPTGDENFFSGGVGTTFIPAPAAQPSHSHSHSHSHSQQQQQQQQQQQRQPGANQKNHKPAKQYSERRRQPTQWQQPQQAPQQSQAPQAFINQPSAFPSFLEQKTEQKTAASGPASLGVWGQKGKNASVWGQNQGRVWGAPH